MQFFLKCMSKIYIYLFIYENHYNNNNKFKKNIK